MSEQPPAEPPPPIPPPSEPSSTDHGVTGDSGGGCAFVGGLIAGFVLFFALGGIVLAGLGRHTDITGPAYLVLAAILAVWLAFKRSWRGFAIGILLGEGALLLLIAICSGFKPG